MPGYTARGCPSKLWQHRLTVTTDGFVLFVKYVHAEHGRKPVPARRKLDKASLENASAQCQALHALVQETLHSYPLRQDLGAGFGLEIVSWSMLLKLREGCSEHTDILP